MVAVATLTRDDLDVECGIRRTPNPPMARAVGMPRKSRTSATGAPLRIVRRRAPRPVRAARTRGTGRAGDPRVPSDRSGASACGIADVHRGEGDKCALRSATTGASAAPRDKATQQVTCWRATVTNRSSSHCDGWHTTRIQRATARIGLVVAEADTGRTVAARLGRSDRQHPGKAPRPTGPQWPGPLDSQLNRV